MSVFSPFCSPLFSPIFLFSVFLCLFCVFCFLERLLFFPPFCSSFPLSPLGSDTLLSPFPHLTPPPSRAYTDRPLCPLALGFLRVCVSRRRLPTRPNSHHHDPRFPCPLTRTHPLDPPRPSCAVCPRIPQHPWSRPSPSLSLPAASWVPPRRPAPQRPAPPRCPSSRLLRMPPLLPLTLSFLFVSYSLFSFSSVRSFTIFGM